MLRYIVATILLASALAAPSLLNLDGEWNIFQQTHNKKYTGDDAVTRRTIWESNVKMIQQHNLEADRGIHSYRLGMNHLGDMTRMEIVSMLNGYKQAASRTGGATYMAPSNVGDLPSTVDWRSKGYVTPVKQQGSCGSCWAFSATGSLEGQHFKQTGQLVSLSEQNLVDCSRKEGNTGCAGGYMIDSFTYIRKNKGIDTEESYPYTAKDGKCQFKSANVGATDVGYTNITKGNETALKSAVATVGPVSVSIDASHFTFAFYKSGIHYNANCSSVILDHAVLAVGYGTDEGDYWLVKNRSVVRYGTDRGDYWLVKNSWGMLWGMHGYIKMARNRDNNCGIATAASYPMV